MNRAFLMFVAGILALLTMQVTVTCAGGSNAPRFTGAFSDSAVDDNGDGFYEYLIVSGEIDLGADADSLGDWDVLGRLCTMDESTISTRPTMYHTSIFGPTQIDYDSGVAILQVQFSGEDIRDSKIDGPYVAQLILARQDSNIETRFTTSEYKHTAFRESPAGILDLVSARGVDTTGNGLFDYLETRVVIEIVRSGGYEVRGYLNIEPVWISSIAPVAVKSEPGIDTVSVIFDGGDINKALLDGDCPLHIILGDLGITFSQDETFIIRGFKHTQFCHE